MYSQNNPTRFNFKLHLKKPKIDAEKWREMLQEISYSNDHFYSLRKNLRTIRQSPFTYEWSESGTGQTMLLNRSATDREYIIEHISAKKERSLFIFAAEDPSILIFSRLYHERRDVCLKAHLEFWTTTLNQRFQPSSKILENEAKALEWMRVSFKILQDAVKKHRQNSPDESLCLQLFFGNEQKIISKDREDYLSSTRLIIFNLDIHYKLLRSGGLEIKIYDRDKLKLQGTFFGLPREMMEELILLLVFLKQDFVY